MPSQMVGVSASVSLSLHPKVRSSLVAPAHLDGPRKRAVKWLWCGCGVLDTETLGHVVRMCTSLTEMYF